MSVLICLPSIWPPYTTACLASMAPQVRALTMVVHNEPPNENLGVDGAWALGVDRVLADGLDWMVALSAAIRFGPAGGVDLLDVLDRFGEDDQPPPMVEAAGRGWRLIAFHRRTFEVVGRFDTQFWPGYGSESDFHTRCVRARAAGAPIASTAPGGAFGHANAPIDCTHVSESHGVILGGVVVDHARNQQRYEAKWGAWPNAIFEHPYDDPSLDWTYVGPPPQRPVVALGEEARTMSLDDLALHYGTDKGSVCTFNGAPGHGYCDWYEHHFAYLRDVEFTLVEIGVERGGSLRMWRDWFPKAHVIGVDTSADWMVDGEERITTWRGDATYGDFWDKHDPGPLTVVIDDASHYGPTTGALFDILWPKVVPGGWFVVEDLTCAFSPRYGGGPHGSVATSLVSARVPDAVQGGELHVYRDIAFVRKAG